jgi:uncharacterized protein YutE (UPF0331/DUF86 family)
MINDVCINKAANIRRCLERIAQEYGHDAARLENFTHQDAIVLNLQRACESAIDLAMHWVAEQKLGTPQTSRDAFEILSTARVLDAALSQRLQRMVGFRNIAVHDYMKIQVPILQSILDQNLGDFDEFATTAQNALSRP